MSSSLVLTSVFYISLIVMGALASYYPELQHVNVSVPSAANSSSTPSTLEFEYKYGPFRACLDASVFFNETNTTISFASECHLIQPDCSVDFDNLTSQLSMPSNAYYTFGNDSGIVTINQTSLKLTECPRFNVMRGTLVSGIVFAAFSALAALIICCQVVRTVVPREAQSSSGGHSWTALFFSGITLVLFVIAFVLGYLHNATTDNQNDDIKDYYDDLKSRGFSLWLMAASAGVSAIALLLWMVSVCCCTRRTPTYRAATADTPFISSRQSRQHRSYQSHSASSPYV